MLILFFIFAEEYYDASEIRREFNETKTEETGDGRNGLQSDGESLTVSAFDPNTVTYEELREMGVPKIAAAAVIRARARGKVFIVKEDFAATYALDDSTYQRLKPYIVIGSEYLPVRHDYGHRDRYDRRSDGRSANEVHYVPFRLDTATVAFLKTIGFSHRRAEAFLNYRDMRGGLRSIEEVAECYVIDRPECDSLEKYIIFNSEGDGVAGRRTGFAQRPVEINTADSAALRSVYGIGEKSVTAIMEYRRRLGGFHSAEQLAEIKEVTESNFERILPQICCDSCNISKIDINFADPKSLYGHPYISDRNLRKLLKKRQLKGGWSRIEEMVEDEIFTNREAEKLRPYLRFTQDSL